MPAYGGVVAATDIALERSLTVGRVAAAGLVKKERVLTSGRVFISAGVLLQRTPTEGTVGKATDVFKSANAPVAVLKPPLVLNKALQCQWLYFGRRCLTRVSQRRRRC